MIRTCNRQKSQTSFYMGFYNLKIKLFMEEIYFSLSSTKPLKKNKIHKKPQTKQKMSSCSAAYFYLHSGLLKYLSNENTKPEGVDLKLSEVKRLTVY